MAMSLVVKLMSDEEFEQDQSAVIKDMVDFDDDGFYELHRMTGGVHWMREKSGNYMHFGVMPNKRTGFNEATLAIKNDERV